MNDEIDTTLLQLKPQKPYLLRAIWQWCTDQGLTPYILVHVSKSVRVPPWVIHDDRVTLNIGLVATNQLEIGDDLITFQARFSGALQDIIVPINNVKAIFAKENNAGMAFEVTAESLEQSDFTLMTKTDEVQGESVKLPSTTKKNPGLKRVK